MLKDAGNIVTDLKGMASTGVRAVRTRLELIGIELKEEKAWLVRSVVVAIAALYLVTFGLLLAVVALALYASEESRPLIVAIAAAVFLVAGFSGGAWLALQSKKRHRIFDETIKVLRGDEEGLQRMVRGTGD